MASSSSPTFLGLPREVRNKIYRAALCTFEPRPSTIYPPPDVSVAPTFMNELAIVEHDIDTSILLVSKQIHQEAYDVMVKKNRFVRVTTSGGFPLRLLLNHLRVPVVTEVKESVDNFQGYVLSVTLTFPKEVGQAFQDTPFSVEPCSLMLLSRDMDVLCDVLMDGDTHLPGFGTNVAIKIAVAPGSILSSSSYKDPISDFFSEKTQQIRGLVFRSIAEAVEEELAQDTASDPEAVLSKFQSLKDEGQSLFRSKQTEAANLKWMDAALEIEQLHESSSWPVLTGKSGETLFARLAELYFLMKLNISHINLANMEKGYVMQM
ncbi:uncharacterized protein N0V89_001186 [Didymosphaeria variabile]|uniref:Uncharacterized protein n=1 Tax=Didymosphaeria variabile TaxID=1932322 RepID=A0A9W9CGI4_9PLEO|nr:uncharacterized protein N0V89_001186 [Didymosphaeria variabile]KAJ4360620.1 hypothetical protein N0V89_001186 [Didymosphaeria variabile]